MPPMAPEAVTRTLFNIAIGYDEKTNLYRAIVHSLIDDKVARVPNDENLKVVLSEVVRMVRERRKLITQFPLPEAPEPSRILAPNGLSLVR
jgi:hypothetical protein